MTDHPRRTLDLGAAAAHPHAPRRPRPAPPSATGWLAALAATIAPAQSRAQEASAKPTVEPVVLHHGLVAGTTFAYAIEIDATVAFDDTKKNSTMRFALHFAATAGAPEGTATPVAHKLLRVEAKLATPLAKIDYDSAKKDSNAGQLTPLASLVGETFVVHVDATGHIERVDLPKALQGDGKATLGTGFDSLFALYFVPLPAEAIAPDQCWQASVPLVDAQLIKGGVVPVKNRLVAVRDGRAEIERSFELPRTPTQPGLALEILESKGGAEFDLQTGRVVRSHMQLSAKATRSLGAGATATGQSTVHVVVHTEN